MSTLVGTGFVVLARRRLDRVRDLCLPERTEVRAAAGLWAFLAIIFGPLALMILYVLPKNEPKHGGTSGTAKHTDPHDALYEVPKKKH